MKPIKKYALMLYTSAVVGLGTVGWLGYDIIKNDFEITQKELARTAVGLTAYFAFWIPGARGAFKESAKKNLEKKIN
jgi:uncharacterized membrane protein